jgi:hypothetical protein
VARLIFLTAGEGQDRSFLEHTTGGEQQFGGAGK